MALLQELENKGYVTLGRGQIISKEDIQECPGNFPVYSSSATENGEFGRYGKYMFDDERITWSIDGGGKMFYRNNHKYSVTNVCGWLKVHTDKLLTKYVYYCMLNQWLYLSFDYQYKAHPSVIRQIYDIPLIDVKEQQKIVDVLDKLNTLIDIESKEFPILDELIKSRFIEMFLFNKDYPIQTWNDVLTIYNGKDYKKNKSDRNNGFPVYGSGGFMGVYADDFLCEGILTIIGRKGTIDRPLLVKGKIWNIDTAFAIKTKNSLNPIYFYYRSKLYDYLGMNKQTTKPSLKKSDLLKLSIEVPPMEKQCEFTSFVESVDKLKFKTQERIKLYQELLNKKMDEYFN